MTIKVNMDGACNNKQENAPMGIGVAVFIDGMYDEELSIARGFSSPYEGLRSTNNIAEWLGCIEAMRVISDLKRYYKDAEFEVYSDSEVVTYVFNGKNKTHIEHFKEYMKRAKEYDSEVKIIHVPRELNKEADKLSKIGKEMVNCKKES